MMSRFGNTSKYVATAFTSFSRSPAAVGAGSSCNTSSTIIDAPVAGSSASGLSHQARIFAGATGAPIIAAEEIIAATAAQTHSAAGGRTSWWSRSRTPAGSTATLVMDHPSHIYRAPELFNETTMKATTAVSQMAATVNEWQADPMIQDGPIHFVCSWILLCMMVSCCLEGYQRVRTAQLDADPTEAGLNTTLMLGWLSESRTTHTPVGI